jgi:hypothetical protein
MEKSNRMMSTYKPTDDEMIRAREEGTTETLKRTNSVPEHLSSQTRNNRDVETYQFITGTYELANKGQ